MKNVLSWPIHTTCLRAWGVKTALALMLAHLLSDLPTVNRTSKPPSPAVCIFNKRALCGSDLAIAVIFIVFGMQTA